MNSNNSNTIKIRPLRTDQEKDQCAAIMLASDPWATLKITHERLLASLSDDMSDVYVMYHGTELVGLSIIQLQGPLSGYIKSVCIASEWRNRKLGKMLVDFTEATIFATCPNVFLCVSSFNSRARKFYLDNGYETIGELKDLMVEGHSEWLMRKTSGPICDFARD